MINTDLQVAHAKHWLYHMKTHSTSIKIMQEECLSQTKYFNQVFFPPSSGKNVRLVIHLLSLILIHIADSIQDQDRMSPANEMYTRLTKQTFAVKKG